MNLLKYFFSFFIKPNDNETDRINKSVLLATVLFKCVGCFGWFVMYYSLGFVLAWKFPIVYLSLLILTSYYLYKTNKFLRALNFYLAYILILPVLLQVSMGGFVNSGAVVIWALLAPTGALYFRGKKEGTIWFSLFVLMVIVASVLEVQIPIDHQSSPITIILFFFMNICVVASFIFYTMTYYRELSSAANATILNQKELLQENNTQLNHQKDQIKNQHSLLEEQHNVLILEQNKTQNVLQKIETLFGQHVSREVADKLISNDGLNSESKSYEVTIMFLDIRDFSLFADSRPPEEVAIFQNLLFSEYINLVRENKGIVLQLLGDGILAVFGAPIKTTNHPNNAVNAGFEVLKKTKELTETDQIPHIKIGIGLHTGKVIAGEIGNKYRKSYSITGSNVIIASRIEQFNKKLESQFLVSESVYEKISKDGYDIAFQGSHELKGISNEVKIYRLA